MMFYAADYRRLARENLRGNWGLSIAVVFMATLLGGALGGSSMSVEIPSTVQKLAADFMPALLPFLRLYSSSMLGLGLAQLILGGAVSLGNARYHLDQYDRKPLAFKTLFSRFDLFGAGLGMSLLIDLYCVLWGLLPVAVGSIAGLLLDLFTPWYGLLLVIAFLIPFAVTAYNYSLAFYLMAEYPEMGVHETLRASRILMRGRKWELFCLDFSFIGWIFLAALTFGVGNLFLGPYLSATNAAFYRQIKDPRQNAGNDERNLSYESI